MILTNCRVIPELCEGFQDEMIDIRVEGGKIAEILPNGGTYINEEVLDCTGKTVLPGLHNIHVHLDMRTHDREYVLKNHKDPKTFVANTITYAQTLLACGYTSVRDSGGPYFTAGKVRDMINNKEIVGPEIKAPGWILTPDWDCGTFYVPVLNHSSHCGHPVNSPADARKEVRYHLSEGADYIKLLGAGWSKRRGQDRPLFYDDEMEEFARCVELENTYLCVHTTGPENIAQSIKYDVWSIEHAINITQENIDEIVKRGKKSNIVMTCSNQLANWDMFRDQNAGVRDAFEAGITIGWGTDCNMAIFLKEPAGEWRARKTIGFTDLEMLKSVTIDSAKINKTSDRLGSIKVGKQADFAIFDGKPDEDYTIFNYPAAYVIKAGEIVARDGFVRMSSSAGSGIVARAGNSYQAEEIKKERKNG